MKKIFTIITAIIAITTTANAQSYIKTNGLYWLALLPNAQIETVLSDKVTLQVEVNASLWTNIKNAPQMGAQFILNPRWYFKNSIDGFYVGGDVAADIFKMSKWNYWSSNTEYSHSEQRGYGFYIGAMGGYQMKVANRINVDFYAGAGWHLGIYRGYRVNKSTGKETMYVDWNRSGEWIPYRIGAAISYRLQRF